MEALTRATSPNRSADVNTRNIENSSTMCVLYDEMLALCQFESLTIDVGTEIKANTDSLWTSQNFVIDIKS